MRRSPVSPSANAGLDWHIAGIGDFNNDSRDDILWRNDNGDLTDWLGNANGGFASSFGNAFYEVSAGYSATGELEQLAGRFGGRCPFAVPAISCRDGSQAHCRTLGPPLTAIAGQRLGIKEVDESIWLTSFMHYDLGYIDLEQKTLQPIDNPFGPGLSPMS
jgi:hypothetical protein